MYNVFFNDKCVNNQMLSYAWKKKQRRKNKEGNVTIICPFIELSLNLSSGSLQSDINCGFVNVISSK